MSASATGKPREATIPQSRARSPRSLTAEAWKRLCSDRWAVVSLWILGGMSFLAVAAPALPLSPPRLVRTERQFQPPRFWPLFEYGFRSATGTETSSSSSSQRPSREVLLEEGFGRLGPLSGFLLRIRWSIFGEWCLAPVCGTDKLGRDLFSRILWGARVSLAVGIVATLVSLVIGVTYGAIAGFAGGRVDRLMMRLVDILYSVPFIFVVIFIITIVSAEPVRNVLENRWGLSRIMIFFLVVGAIYWLTMARVVRGQVISLRHELYVEAARALGASWWRILFRHILPNLISVVVVYLTLTIPRVMLFEAFLSFLGLGVEPPDVSWGLLANEGLQAITPIKIYWWLVVFPGVALALTLFALNFLGDSLRDALDPRLKHIR
ncbi:ABC transporter permease [Thermogutta sp.]|uniref:ABC transporter permease n=1 Tax=Thermogutta sp. TaxID=1962930 RepID=UPI00321FFB63